MTRDQLLQLRFFPWYTHDSRELFSARVPRFVFLLLCFGDYGFLVRDTDTRFFCTSSYIELETICDLVER